MIKLDKTKELANIYNSITQELESQTFNFNVEVEAFKTAISEFEEELDFNVLNCNEDLIISRLRKLFKVYYPDYDLVNFDEESAELLSTYGKFAKKLYYFYTEEEGLQELRKIIKEEQRQDAANTPKPIIQENVLNELQPQQTAIQNNQIRQITDTSAIESNIITEQPVVVSPQPTTKNKIVKLQRKINTEILSNYFKAQFKGMGNNSINYFDWLVRALETDRTDKEFGQIAAMCYDGKHMNGIKPKTFNAWYIIFCECVGCKKRTYTHNKLTNPPDTLKTQFSYL